jgi:hypothetical protein
VHRDLSADHVFMARGRIVVTDYDMTKRVADLPVEGVAVCRGYEFQSIGVMLWELICGRALFSCRQPHGGIDDAANQSPERKRRATHGP